ncbi:MAG: hypothetical protein JXA17_08160 [Dehalococcoidales bacterium]|nr:hypothetical protein [Dehalococcoidales bacterium]
MPKLYELACSCYVYAAFTKFDEAYDNLIKQIDHRIEMHNKTHLEALLQWLSKFGCRQFKKSYYIQTSKSLESWYDENEQLLPPFEKTLSKLSIKEIDNLKSLYKTLSKVKASENKTVGPTGAAKILFVLRKDVFPPWDIAIRKGRYSGSCESYIQFLINTKQQLLQLVKECQDHGIKIDDLPKLIDRPSSSLVKLIDEYNWVNITHNCLPPTPEKIENWYQWSKSK